MSSWIPVDSSTTIEIGDSVRDPRGMKILRKDPGASVVLLEKGHKSETYDNHDRIHHRLDFSGWEILR